METTFLEIKEDASDNSISLDVSAVDAVSRTGELWETPEDTLLIPEYTRPIEETMRDYIKQVEELDLDNYPHMQDLLDKISAELEITLGILSNAGRNHQPVNKKKISDMKLLRSSTFALNKSLMQMATYDNKISKLCQALQMTLSQVDVLGELFSRANQSRIEAKKHSRGSSRNSAGSECIPSAVTRVKTPKSILSAISVNMDSMNGRNPESKNLKTHDRHNGIVAGADKQVYRAKPNSVATLHLFGRHAAILD